MIDFINTDNVLGICIINRATVVFTLGIGGVSGIFLSGTFTLKKKNRKEKTQMINISK